MRSEQLEEFALSIPEEFSRPLIGYDRDLSGMQEINAVVAEGLPGEHAEMWEFVRSAYFAQLLETADDEKLRQLFTLAGEVADGKITEDRITGLNGSVTALAKFKVDSLWISKETERIDLLDSLSSSASPELAEMARDYLEFITPFIGNKAVRLTEREVNPEIKVSSDKVYYLADGLPAYLAGADISEREPDGWVTVSRLSKYAEGIARLSSREDMLLAADKIARFSFTTKQTYLSQAIELLLAEDEPEVEFKRGHSIHSGNGLVKLVRLAPSYTAKDSGVNANYGDSTDDISRFSREAKEYQGPFSELAIRYFELMTSDHDGEVVLRSFQSVLTPVEELIASTLDLVNEVEQEGLEAMQSSGIRLQVYGLERDDLKEASRITQQVWGMFVREVYRGNAELAQRFLDGCITSPTEEELRVWKQLSVFRHLRQAIDSKLNLLNSESKI